MRCFLRYGYWLMLFFVVCFKQQLCSQMSLWLVIAFVFSICLSFYLRTFFPLGGLLIVLAFALMQVTRENQLENTRDAISQYFSSSRSKVFSYLYGEIVAPCERISLGKMQCELKGVLSRSKHFAENCYASATKDASCDRNSVSGVFLLEFPDVPWSVAPKLERGSVLLAEALVSNPDGRGFDDRKSFLNYVGASTFAKAIAGVHVDEIEHLPLTFQYRLVKKLIETFGSRESLGVLVAMTIGYKSLLSEHTSNVFRHLGLSHLLVVSGFHLGIVFFLVRSLFCRLLYFCPTVMEFISRKKSGASLSLLAIFAYAMLCGWKPSLLRAVISSFLLLLLFAYNRSRSSIVSLIICAILVSLLLPGSERHLGYQLSFSAVAGILLALRIQERLMSRRPSRFDSVIAVSLGAWTGSTIVLYLWFGEIQLLAPLMNIVFTPIISLLSIGGGCIAVFCFSLGLPGGAEMVEASLTILAVLLETLEIISKSLGESFGQLQPDSVSECGILVCSTIVLTLLVAEGLRRAFLVVLKNL